MRNDSANLCCIAGLAEGCIIWCQEGGRTENADEDGKLLGEHDAAATAGSPLQISKVTWRSFGKDAKVTNLLTP